MTRDDDVPTAKVVRLVDRRPAPPEPTYFRRGRSRRGAMVLSGGPLEDVRGRYLGEAIASHAGHPIRILHTMFHVDAPSADGGEGRLFTVTIPKFSGPRPAVALRADESDDGRERVIARLLWEAPRKPRAVGKPRWSSGGLPSTLFVAVSGDAYLAVLEVSTSQPCQEVIAPVRGFSMCWDVAIGIRATDDTGGSAA